MANLNISLNALRALLLEIKPAGEDGFEALIAEVLASVTRLVFRRAKSGSQFGRDAMSAPNPFAIAMEAKRYRDDLSLNDLAGKGGIAAHALEGKIDLWVLAASSAVGDDTQSKLQDMLANSGISLLTLDWTPHPLPPLAVLLASARDKAEAWFATHYPTTDVADLPAIFDDIIADPNFSVQQEQLIQSMRACNVGLDALRHHSTKWLQTRFTDRAQSQLAFGQYITVADPAANVINRDTTLKELAAVVNSTLATPDAASLIVVLGEEGCGKTWLIAQWLTQLAPQPIVLFVAGRRTALLDPARPIRSLAKLFADQDGKSNEAAIAGWERRFERWSASAGDGRMRFVIVLDGLNEHAGKPWASILNAMLPTVTKLGGCLIASCRPAYWEREISLRLGALQSQLLTVSDYSETELASILSREGIDPATLSPKVLEFILNPRVCSVALKLLPQLDQPEALSVERLLLEYWRARLQERGDLLGHNPYDFHQLLRNHAKEWIVEPGTEFDRNEWVLRSPAASGNLGKDFVNDLSDIEEGRFMQVSDIEDGSYTFKQEALPFAIALLITHELKSELKPSKKNTDPQELLQRILEPIRGFDVMSDAIVTATGLACLDKAYPQAARVVLIEASLSMQNPLTDSFDRLTHYVKESPDAFLDVAELEQSNVRTDDLAELLRSNRDHPLVCKAINARLPQWLGRWTRQFPLQNVNIEQDRQESHVNNINDALAGLLPEERNLFDAICSEKSGDTAISLSYLTAILMAGRPQANFAEGLFASRLAGAVVTDFYAADNNLAWVVRFNSVDFLETETALMQQVANATQGSSGSFSCAAAFALRLLGSRAAAIKADELYPQPPKKRSRAIESLCDTNPYDPIAPIGSNLENARSAVAKISGAAVWNLSMETDENRRLEEVAPALARFDHAAIMATLHDVINSIANRADISLHELAWHLPNLSPLFAATEIEAVMAALNRLLVVPDGEQSNDFDFVVLQIVVSLIPHLEAEEQLALLLKLPPRVPAIDDMRRALKVLPPDRLEDYLEHAHKHPESTEMARVLLFASASPALLTQRAREIIVAQVNRNTGDIVGCAVDVVCMARDDLLDKMILKRATPYHSSEDGIYAKTMLRRAIATALIRQKRSDLLNLVSPEFLRHVVSIFGNAAYQELIIATERAIKRLINPIMTLPPASCEAVIGISNNGLETMIGMNDFVESNLEQADDVSQKLERFLSNMGSDERDFESKQAEMQKELTTFQAGLAKESATELTSNLSWHDATLIVQNDAAQVSRWLDQILTIKNRRTLSNIYNFGIVLAGAYATQDANKALQLLEHLYGVAPIVTIVIVIGEARVPLYLQTLFKTASVAALDPLRARFFCEALTDAELETGVISADACGASTWLDDYMSQLLISVFPGEQARGLTIAGLRHKNTLAQSVLAQSWGSGFLGDVAAYARKTYQKNEWASHWFGLAASTDEPIDFWRYGQLAQGIADWRFSRWLEAVPQSTLWHRFGGELLANLKKAAEKRSDKRKQTLFGLKAPDQAIRAALLL